VIKSIGNFLLVIQVVLPYRSESWHCCVKSNIVRRGACRYRVCGFLVYTKLDFLNILIRRGKIHSKTGISPLNSYSLIQKLALKKDKRMNLFTDQPENEERLIRARNTNWRFGSLTKFSFICYNIITQTRIKSTSGLIWRASFVRSEVFVFSDAPHVRFYHQRLTPQEE
jgi:hypothetical protein